MPTFNKNKKNCKAAVLSLWLYADMNAAIKLHSSSAESVTVCRAALKETFSHR